MSIAFTDDGVDLYSSRCMSDPNFIALALTGSEKQGKMQNLTKSCEVSEPYKVGQDSMLMTDLYSSRCMHDPSLMVLVFNDLNTKTQQKFLKSANRKK